MQLMRDAGFVPVFLGIETPDELGLITSNKLQNAHRSPLDSVALIQSYGMQVMGYHFQVMTRKLSQKVEEPALEHNIEKSISEVKTG